MSKRVVDALNVFFEESASFRVSRISAGLPLLLSGSPASSSFLASITACRFVDFFVCDLSTHPSFLTRLKDSGAADGINLASRLDLFPQGLQTLF